MTAPVTVTYFQHAGSIYICRFKFKNNFVHGHRFVVPAQVSKQWQGSRDLTPNSTGVVIRFAAFLFRDRGYMSAAVSHLEWHNVIA